MNSLIFFLFAGIVILATYIYKMHRQDQPQIQVYQSDDQDDLFVWLASSISQAKTDYQLRKCLHHLVRFNKMFGTSVSGQLDMKRLVEMYDQKENQLTGIPLPVH